MDSSSKRRIELSTSWASNRISVLDSLEKYEDSFAITEEFREWIVCLNHHPEQLEDTLLKFPNNLITSIEKEAMDKDELLEL